MLKQNHVKIEILHLIDGNVVHVIPPIATARAATIAFALSFRQVKFERGLREVVKIIAVYMPGKNPQFLLFYRFLPSFSVNTAITAGYCVINVLSAAIAASGVSTALPETTRWRT